MMSKLWKVIFLSLYLVFTWMLVVALSTNESEVYFTERFSKTTDFILQQIEEQTFDKEFRTLAPRNFKRNVFFEERKDDCMDNIGTGHCKYLKKHFACVTHPRKMLLYCNKTCNFCVPKKPKCSFTKFGCCKDMVTPASGYYYAGCPRGCFDMHGEKFCNMAKSYSLCSSRNRGIMVGCRKSCGICRPCIDEEPAKCRATKLYGLCIKLKNKMLNQCRKTCGLCGDKDPCGKVSCAARRECIVDRFGEAQCVCKDRCHKGDYYTGVVCGRDGVDYANLCKLKMSICNGIAKKVKWYGKCHPDVSYLKFADCRKKTEHSLCKAWKRAGACQSWRKRMAQACPHTCGMCAAKTNRPSCYYTKHGCCLDGYTQCRGPNYEGCINNKPCVNRYKHLCKRFVSACGERRNKLFMKNNCPMSCFYCPKRSEESIG